MTIVVAKDSRVLHTLVYDVDKIDLEAVQAEVQAIVQSKSDAYDHVNVLFEREIARFINPH